MSKKEIKPILDDHFIIESVYHLIKMSDIVVTFLDKYDKKNAHDFEVNRCNILFVDKAYSLILVNSIFDELNGFLLNYKGSNEKLISKIGIFKYIMDPIFNYLKKWPDIKNFRNNVLAHNFRIKKENYKSVFLSNRLFSYEIPETVIDYLMLYRCIEQIPMIIHQVFEEEYKIALAIVAGQENEINRERDFQQEDNNLRKVFKNVDLRYESVKNKL